MAIPTYDWTEEKIRSVVLMHHTPDERLDPDLSATIICNFCSTSPWPCAIIADLREWIRSNPENPGRGKR